MTDRQLAPLLTKGRAFDVEFERHEINGSVMWIADIADVWGGSVHRTQPHATVDLAQRDAKTYLHNVFGSKIFIVWR